MPYAYEKVGIFTKSGGILVLEATMKSEGNFECFFQP